VVFPISYSETNGVKKPRPTILTGHLNDDERLLAVADRFQSKVDAHQEHPELDPWLEKFENGSLDAG